MSRRVDRVLTQNVWVNAPLGVADAVLRRLLDQEPDIVALQEWPGGRNPLLEATGTFERVPTARRALRRRKRWEPGQGVVWSRPVLGPTGPIGLRADRYELLSCKAVTLTDSRRVRPTPRHPRATLPANRATVVLAHDHEHDEDVVVLGYHLWSGVQVGGHYSQRPGDRVRVDGHRDQVAALGRLIREHLDRDRVVYALGDSNFHGLKLPGLVSAWDGRENQPRGTHRGSRRKIDDVFGPGRAGQVELVDHPDRRIDHQGVLAVRRRD
jgi:hypothetical protein